MITKCDVAPPESVINPSKLFLSKPTACDGVISSETIILLC